jgi:hypothetical protein
VNRAAPEVSIEYRADAADIIVDRGRKADALRFTDDDVEEAVAIARRLQLVAAEVDDAHPPKSAPLNETALSRNTEAEWLQVFAPLVEIVRQKAFGAPEPGFAREDYAGAARWIEAQLAALPVPEVGRLSREYFNLQAQLMRAQSQLSRATGQAWSVGPRRFLVEYYAGDRERAVVRREILGAADDPYATGVPVAAIAAAANNIARVSGFAPADVTAYLLCGAPPTLRRAVVTAGREACSVPAGEAESVDVSGAYVEVHVRTPDLTWKDLRALHQDIRRAWELVDVRLPRATGRQRARLTPLDLALLRVVEALGGYPDDAGTQWWKEVAQRWEADGLPPRDRDSHRRHWKRLMTKAESFDISIAPRTDLP